MRHSFRFPAHIRRAVRQHVETAIASVSPQRYHQEANYTAALAARLEGTVYDGSDGYVKFTSTVVDDRGRSSAESWSGADWAITATISDRNGQIEKAILLQSKLGLIAELSHREYDRLCDQIGDMRRLTRAPKVMETLETDDSRHPRIVSGNRIADNQPYRSYDLGAYFTTRVLTTHDGDTRPDFVAAVQDSGLIKLKLLASTTRNTVR